MGAAWRGLERDFSLRAQGGTTNNGSSNDNDNDNAKAKALL